MKGGLLMNSTCRMLTASLLGATILLLAACGGEKPAIAQSTSKETNSLSAAASPAPEPTQETMPYKAPLTGTAQLFEATNRPVAIMINNFSAARPQSGLTEADVIWEVLAEGGITRLVAIFQSTESLSDTIGPIRSNRAYLIDIADSYDAVMAHAGGSPEAYGILQKQGKPYLDEITNAGSHFWRSKERKAPHNLYSNLEQLRQGVKKKGYGNELPVRAYPFAKEGAIIENTGVQAESAKHIDMTFLMKSYQVNYTYDKLSGSYNRFINDEPHIDLNNNKQLSAANLIVFETSHKTLDSIGRLKVDLQSGGAGYLFQHGKKIDIEWVRSPDGMVRFVKDGKETPLVPGKTYIHVVPNKPNLAEHVTIS